MTISSAKWLMMASIFMAKDVLKEYPQLKIAVQRRQAVLAGFSQSDINEISAKAIKCNKNVVYNYGAYIDANTGFIEISAKPFILQYFYQAGILAHRSIGFGMIDLIAQKNI